MIIENYKSNHLLFNTNFIEQTSKRDFLGYRGDLVLVDSGLDDKGHPNPPKITMKGVVLLGDDKLKLLIGSLDEMAQLPLLLEKFDTDFAEDMACMLFVVNAKERAIFEFGAIKMAIIPLIQGVCWNEVIDELALEKSDFKGQSPADKIKTLYGEMKSYKPKGAVKSLDDLLLATTAVKREAWGAV